MMVYFGNNPKRLPNQAALGGVFVTDEESIMFCLLIMSFVAFFY